MLKQQQQEQQQIAPKDSRARSPTLHSTQKAYSSGEYPLLFIFLCLIVSNLRIVITTTKQSQPSCQVVDNANYGGGGSVHQKRETCKLRNSQLESNQNQHQA